MHSLNRWMERPLRQDPGRPYHGVIATAEPRGLVPLGFRSEDLAGQPVVCSCIP